MLKVAQQKADGILFFMRPLPDVKARCRELGSATFKVCTNVITCVSPNREVAEARVRRTVAFYISHGGAYRRLVERLAPPGAKDAIAAIKDDWLKGRREDAGRRVPQELLRDVAIFGTPTDCRRAMEEYLGISGLNMLGLQFNAGTTSFDESLNLYSTLFRNE